MDYYTAHVMVRLEHKERMRTASRIRAYRVAEVSQPRWRWRQLRRLINVTGNGLIAAGKRLIPQQDNSIQHADPQGQHAG